MTGPSEERVFSPPSDKDVITTVTSKRIGATCAADHVVPGCADELILPLIAHDRAWHSSATDGWRARSERREHRQTGKNDGTV